MKPGRTLHPEDRISHYRIVGPLGAGGMGEVYLAQDQTLERNVALKILPPELVRSEERVRRFVLEAKSASSLNHPNIVTIFEIGEDRVRSVDAPGDETESSSVHFISMELVSGKTLSTLIHDERTDLRTLLGYLVQAAEGLSKAHSAGIIHRDLKPGNIMVSSDGYAKVLDFGLAKLVEKRQADPNLTSSPTVTHDATSEGVVLGTAGYMSPEQVQGKPLDHRSDIFSMGCILYEATTRQRPFAAESSVETMHKILHEKPAPIEDLNPNAPAELRRLIRRSLAKAHEQRLQSMKDLAIELREIVEEYDSLSASATSGSSTAASPVPAPARMRTPVLAAVASAALIGLVGIVVGVIGIRRGGREGPSDAFQSMRITTLTNRGDADDAAISPDGRYVAFTSGPPGQRSVWVRQVATGSDIQVLPPQATSPSNLSFSPDGNYIYYLRADPERATISALFEIPALGGSARRRAQDVDSRVSFAPDGKRTCFRRGVPEKRQDALIILDLDSSREQTLATIEWPRRINASPVWSPGGDQIAIAEFDPETRFKTRLVFFRVEDGRRDTLRSDPRPLIRSMAWQPDGRGLIVSDLDLVGTRSPQIFYVSYPDGRSRRITNDVDAYSKLSVSSNGETIAAVRFGSLSSLWTVQADGRSGAHQIVPGTSRESSVWTFAPAADGSIVFLALSDRFSQLWTIGADGSGRRPITSGRAYVGNFQCRLGGIVYLLSDEQLGNRHLWRTDASAEEPRQLTDGPGEILRDVSPDGHLVLFAHQDTPGELWAVPTEGGEPHRIAGDFEGGAWFSPDGGRLLSVASEMTEGRSGQVFKIVAVTGGEPTLTVLPPRAAGVDWAPDGRSLAFRDEADSSWSLFRQPLDSITPERITHLVEGRITGYQWSPDGSKILLRRRIGKEENLWVINADGSGAEPITRFETGVIFGMRWALDSASVTFTYGTESSDVVLIRNVK